MKNNFFNLLQYTNTILDEYDDKKAIQELKHYIDFSNEYVYDIINYEKLIYIELTFANNKEINELLAQLK